MSERQLSDTLSPIKYKPLDLDRENQKKPLNPIDRVYFTQKNAVKHKEDTSLKNDIVILFYFVASLFLSACVSVNIPLSQKSTKSSQVKFQEPGQPFAKHPKQGDLDGLWLSKKTKSTIGFYSLCHKDLPPLKNARSNSLSGIEGSQVIKENTLIYNDREALRSIIEGKLEGFLFQIESLLFVKDSCLFEISYVAYKENFNKEISIYRAFLDGFKVK